MDGENTTAKSSEKICPYWLNGPKTASEVQCEQDSVPASCAHVHLGSSTPMGLRQFAPEGDTANQHQEIMGLPSWGKVPYFRLILQEEWSCFFL